MASTLIGSMADPAGDGVAGVETTGTAGASAAPTSRFVFFFTTLFTFRPDAQVYTKTARGSCNVCEMKFVTGEFSIGAKYAAELENKLSVFREELQTNKSLLLTMITVSGVKRNEYSYLVHSQIRLDDLFNE